MPDLGILISSLDTELAHYWDLEPLPPLFKRLGVDERDPDYRAMQQRQQHWIDQLLRFHLLMQADWTPADIETVRLHIRRRLTKLKPILTGLGVSVAEPENMT